MYADGTVRGAGRTAWREPAVCWTIVANSEKMSYKRRETTIGGTSAELTRLPNMWRRYPTLDVVAVRLAEGKIRATNLQPTAEKSPAQAFFFHRVSRCPVAAAPSTSTWRAVHTIRACQATRTRRRSPS
ncbi:hypothetical protein BIW11_03361 [Tropilaelaps mercedesae]|uniref:Uncharacterized protein n=1 Tax=Tropilaelaps mercedesae TaxID=418985 RepID=A0A1V9XMQ1_9ACAR|nr:hypothetical protein BIW11_03361 [Tropilaelaps mercedesae]